MRNLKKLILVLAWLWNVSLCHQHAHDNLHNRGLSDILQQLESGGGQSQSRPKQDGVLENIINEIAAKQGQGQIQGQIHTTSAVQQRPTSLVGGPNGVNSAWFRSSPPVAGAPSRAVGGSAAPPGASIPPGAALGSGTTTIRNTVRITTTVTLAAPSAIGNGPGFFNVTRPQAGATGQPANQVVPPKAGSTGNLPGIVKPPGNQPANQVAPPPAGGTGTRPNIVKPPNQQGALQSLTTGAPGAVATGRGTLLPNGECQCLCLCGVGSFPTAAPQQQVPPGGFVSNGTTLQTIINPPSTSVALPSSLLIDTSAIPAPPAPTSVASSDSSVSSGASSSSAGSQSTASISLPPAQTPIPPPAAAPAQTPDSTIKFSLIQTTTDANGQVVTPRPTALPDLQSAVVPGGNIDISQFTLHSTLALGNIGG